MKKKIIIYINQICLRGGVEKVFYTLINNLTPDKYDITILTTVAYISDDLKIGIYDDTIKRYFFYFDEFSKNFFVRQLQKLYNKIAPFFIDRIIKSKKWDIAIAAQEGMYAEYIAKISAHKKYLWIHNDMHQITTKNFKTKTAEKKCYDSFDKVICVSEDVKQSMLDIFGTMNNLCVKYNPIDTIEIDLKSKENIAETPANHPLFVSIGRLAHQKGFDRLLPIVKKLNDEGYIFEVWIVGEGVERKNLEDYIKMHNINNVTLLGYRANPFAYIKLADWIICTSRFEGFNTVLQESIYLQKPIITTNNAGAHELLGNNEYGIIMPNTDEDIYKGLKHILDNPNLQNYYSNKAFERKSFIALKDRIQKIEVIRGFIINHNGPKIVCLYWLLKFRFTNIKIKSLY